MYDWQECCKVSVWPCQMFPQPCISARPPSESIQSKEELRGWGICAVACVAEGTNAKNAIRHSESASSVWSRHCFWNTAVLWWNMVEPSDGYELLFISNKQIISQQALSGFLEAHPCTYHQHHETSHQCRQTLLFLLIGDQIVVLLKGFLKLWGNLQLHFHGWHKSLWLLLRSWHTLRGPLGNKNHPSKMHRQAEGSWHLTFTTGLGVSSSTSSWPCFIMFWAFKCYRLQ